MRLKTGYSQAQLSQISCINLRSLQDYEQGHKSVASAKGETLYRLSKALGYSMEEIILEYLEKEGKGDESRIAAYAKAYEDALNKKKNREVHFPVIVSDNKVDMSRIYPTRQKMVKNVIDLIRKDKRLSTVLLFGSSITMRCHKKSDLDFAVGLKTCTDSDKNEISENIQQLCEWGADILWLDRINSSDRIYNDIMNGLVIL